MSIRKRNDSVKPGCGIDGSEGENYTKKSGNPWDSNPRGDYLSTQGAGKYQAKSASFLTNKPQNGGTSDMSDARDIWDAVEGQSSDSGNRAVKSGNKD
jgi:hypothetical protein